MIAGGHSIISRRGVLKSARPTNITFATYTKSVLTDSSEGFFVASIDDMKISDVNVSFCKMVGHTKENLIGMRLDDFCCTSTKEICKQAIATLTPAKVNQCELQIQTRHGRNLFVRVNATLLDGIGGQKYGTVVGFVSNITHCRTHADFLGYQVLRDEATDLPNRASLNNLLSEALSAANNGQVVAVILIDIDDFKQYNDAHGRRFGDMVLALTASRLQNFCSHNCQVARVGGDEFAIVINGKNAEELKNFATQISDALRESTVLAGQHTYTSVSIGIAMAPDHGTTADDLMKRADTAVHAAKKASNDGISFFSFSMETETQQKLALNALLRKAHLNGDFYLVYQPQVDIHTGEIIGVESLLRLKNTGLGLAEPAHFIPALEDSGLIIPVGEWALCHSIQKVAEWSRQNYKFRMSVNISAKQFKDPLFARRVIDAIQRENADPSQVCLEITESTLMEDLDLARKQLTELAGVGVTISIDDFGTGYSSLKYLQKLPVREIKIDRSFVRGLSSQSDDTIIVKTIAKLGQSLGLDVVAEGVESACHARHLQDYGATHGQGFLYSHPLPEEELLLLFQENVQNGSLGYAAKIMCPCGGHDKNLPVCSLKSI